MSSSTTTTGGSEASSASEDGPRKAKINGALEGMLTPELLFKMNKKIAQLTKVVYGLNTRGEELENQLTVTKESEEKTKLLNTDLQHRVNTFKNKIENEMGRLRELETQANQSQIWKLECENLQRRLDSLDGSGGDSIALSLAREEIEQSRRRESSLQYELEQARHAITNLKAHHDFMMRERDAQQAMENEKIVLEWQTRLAELEARYKSQIRRITDDFEVLSSECEILRGRISRAPSATEEGILRDQILALQIQNDSDRRELEMKLRRQKEELEDEKQRRSEERKELIKKAQNSGKNEDVWEERMRSKCESYEQKIHDLMEKSDILQKVLEDKEDEFEVRLKTKVVEWKSEWDAAEDGLKKQIVSLQKDNDKLRAESKAMRFSVDKAGIENVNRIQELEEELSDVKSDIEMKSKNFKIRINVAESNSNQLRQEKQDLENKIEEEKERFKTKMKTFDALNESAKEDLKKRLQQTKETEKMLKEANRLIEEENESIKNEKEQLAIKLRDKQREWEIKIENEIKSSEVRTKQKVERTWLDKLKKSEESAANDLEKLQDSNRRKEDALKRELSVAHLGEEEAKNLNEELKKKLKVLRQSDAEKAKKLKELENQMENRAVNEVSSLRKELAIQEQKYQQRIDDLSMKLSEKQAEVSDLVEEIRELKDSSEKDDTKQELEIKIEELKRLIREKEAVAESVRVELQYTKNETDLSRAKMKRLEEELNEARQNIICLQTKNSANSSELSRTKELEEQLKKVEENLKKSEFVSKDLQKTLSDIEKERDEELKIVQDALDEAAQEREDLIGTFEKELKGLNATNTAREQQMLDDFEWKLREMEKNNKRKLDEKEKQVENTLQRVKRQTDDEDIRQKVEKMKNELNAEWEDKLRSGCSRLKCELDELHFEEKHLAVESMKLQKEEEIRSLNKSWEARHEETTKEVSRLKDNLTDKDAFYHNELDSQRTSTDREIWDLRMKLQKLTENTYDLKQQMEEKHKDEMERFRVDYQERIRELEQRWVRSDAQSGVDIAAKIEKDHKMQMEHFGEQHQLSMERLREELESEKFQAVEEARVIITQHHEYIESNLKEQLTEIQSNSNQANEELENLRQNLYRKEEILRNLEEDMERLRESKGDSFSSSSHSVPPAHSSTSSGFSSQFSLASSNDSRNSQDRYSNSENYADNAEDAQKSGNGGLLGKVFGGGWFTPSKSSSRRGSTPLSNKKPY